METLNKNCVESVFFLHGRSLCVQTLTFCLSASENGNLLDTVLTSQFFRHFNNKNFKKEEKKKFVTFHSNNYPTKSPNHISKF